MKKPNIKAPIPENLGKVVDLYKQVREYRLSIQHEVDEVKEYESALRQALIDNLPKSQLTGVAGRLARATIVEKETAKVEDWDAFYKHVKRTGNFDLLGRRLNEKAVKERWADKKQVPGVGHFKYKDVSITQV